MPELELVIFDCDGVLVDSERISCRVMAEAITEAGLPCTTEQAMREYMGRSWADSLALVEARLGRRLGNTFTESYRARRDAALRKEVRAVAGVRKAIEGIPVDRCVASSGAPEKIRLTLGTTGLLELFEGRIFSATDQAVERGKPHPDLFLHAAGTLGHEPLACVVVEDAPLGVEAAQAAGMRVLGYTGSIGTEPLEAAGAETFDEMEELPRLLGFSD